jgi:hypothetical protein
MFNKTDIILRNIPRAYLFSTLSFALSLSFVSENAILYFATFVVTYIVVDLPSLKQIHRVTNVSGTESWVQLQHGALLMRLIVFKIQNNIFCIATSNP